MASDDDFSALWRAVQAGDKAAQEQFFTRYRTQIESMLRRAIPADQSDIASSVFRSFLKDAKAGKLPFFDNPGGVVSWLINAARHKAIDKHRDKARQQKLKAALALRSTASSEKSPSQFAAERELYKRFRAQLREEEARIVDLKLKEDLSFKEIGDRLGVTEEAARKRFQRIIERLRKFVAE